MQLSKTAGDFLPAPSIASSRTMKNSQEEVVFKLNSSLIPLSPTTKAGVFSAIGTYYLALIGHKEQLE